MTITVDANILFSALITPSGRLAKIICAPGSPAQLISGYYLLEELTKHQDKIVRYAKKPQHEVEELKQAYIRNIQLYDETLIHQKCWLQAEALTILT